MKISEVQRLAETLTPEFVKPYEQFFYEYTEKKKNEIECIQDGSLKLYAVEQSAEIYDWEDIFLQIEEAYPAFRKICEKPKSRLRAVNEVRPIETVKRIGYESIPYLASHSEDWLARTASGLKPARLFSRVEDDNYQIYENCVVKTLIDSIISFLRLREKELNNQYEQLKSIMNSNVQVGSFGFDASFQKAVFELVKSDGIGDERRLIIMKRAQILHKKVFFLLKKYRSLKTTFLYRYLRRVRAVSNPLSETNLLLLDRHYSVIFKLWKLIHKERKSKLKEVIDTDKIGEDESNYKQFCMTLAGYAAHVLHFEIVEDGIYIRKDGIGLEICEKEERIELVVKDLTKHSLKVSGEFVLPIAAGECYKKFKFDGNVLYWENTVTQQEIEEFTALLKSKEKQGKERKEGQRRYTELKRMITDCEHQYKAASSYRVGIMPAMFGVKKENSNRFAEYMKERALEIVEKSGVESMIIAMPKCEEGEQRLVDYAFLNQEKVMFLPLSMYDINSFRRIQNVWIRQILKLEKDTCPCCGGKLRQVDNQKICDVCSGLIITTTVCPRENCHKKYTYLSYRVSEQTIQKMQEVEENNFYQFDSLYQYKNIVKMQIVDKKLITVCPYCGQ